MLSELGITGYEEKVYRAILAGARTAKEIASTSGMPPTAVYPTVQSLVKKELVQEIGGVTKQYEAIDPKIGIARLTRQRVKSMNAVQERAIAELKYSPLEQEEKSPITLSRGTVSSITHSYDMMLETTKTFYTLGWNFTSYNSVSMVTKKLSTLKKRGVDVRVLFTHVTPAGDRFRKNLDELKIPYKFIRTGYISIVVADGTKCKLTLKNKALTERLNMVVGDADLAQAMQQYYLTLWKKAKKSF